jgi:hypothetical protein
MVVADVRRRADALDSVACRLTGEIEAVLEVERAVVDPGEDVAVQVDHRDSAQLTPPLAGKP